MPYIPVEARERLFRAGQTPKNAGELNFIITLIVDQYFHENGRNYQAISDILGTLSAAGHEYYRRRIAAYEDRKILENGEVYRGEAPSTAGEGTSATEEKSTRSRANGSKAPSESSSFKKARHTL